MPPKKNSTPSLSDGSKIYKSEWSFVKTFFEKNPSETKYRRQFNLNYMDEYNVNHEITHSFMNFNGKIYRLAHSVNSSLYNYAQTQVKLAIDEGGQTYAMKIQKITPSWETTMEDHISQDLGLLAHAGLYRQGGKEKNEYKYYRPFVYLGRSLFVLLQNNLHLDKNFRLELAINCCIAVYRLHAGLDSKSGTAYFHQDIKPCNMTFDSESKIHLIDFGLSEMLKGEKIAFSAAGTGLYLPEDIIDRTSFCRKNIIISNKKNLGPIGVDGFALKRTLWMDHYKGRTLRSIFNKEMYNSFPSSLKRILDTTSIKGYPNALMRKDTPLYLGALLAAYQHNPSLNIEEFDRVVKPNQQMQIDILYHYRPKILPKIPIQNDASLQDTIYAAVRQGRVDVLRKLNTEGLNFQSEFIRNLMNPLGHLAVHYKQHEVLEALGSFGYDFDITDIDEKATALYYAASYNDCKAIQILAKYKANLNLGNQNNATPIHIAAQQNSVDAINELGQLGADPNIPNRYNETPIQHALFRGYEEAFAKLIFYKADVKDNKTILNNIILENRPDCLLTLHKYGIDLNTLLRENRTLVHSAALKKYGVELIEALAACKMNLQACDANGITPFYLSALWGNYDVFMKFVELGVPLNPKRNSGATPLCAAIQKGHIDIVNELLNRDVPRNEPFGKYEFTNLLIATEYGHLKIVKLLLEDKTLTPLPALVSEEDIWKWLKPNNQEMTNKVNALIKRKLAEAYPRNRIPVMPEEVADIKGFEEIAELLRQHVPIDPDLAVCRL